MAEDKVDGTKDNPAGPFAVESPAVDDIHIKAGQPAQSVDGAPANTDGLSGKAAANEEVVAGIKPWEPVPGNWSAVIDPNGNSPHEVPIENFLQQKLTEEAVIQKAQDQGLIRNATDGNGRSLKPLEKPKDAATIRAAAMLKDQPLVEVYLPQNPPGQPPLPDETVSINGYTYQIQRGIKVKVPKSIREILVQAAMVAPETQEEYDMYPVVAPLVAAALMNSQS